MVARTIRSIKILLRLEASHNFLVMLVLEVINNDLLIEMLPTLFALKPLLAKFVAINPVKNIILKVPTNTVNNAKKA